MSFFSSSRPLCQAFLRNAAVCSLTISPILNLQQSGFGPPYVSLTLNSYSLPSNHRSLFLFVVSFLEATNGEILNASFLSFDPSLP